MTNETQDEFVNLQEQKPTPVKEEILRRVVWELGKRLVGKPEAHSHDFLAADEHGASASVWANTAVKRSVQGWILKIAYDHLGHSQSAAYNLMKVLNAMVIKKTHGRTIEGIEAKDGPRAVLVLLVQIFLEQKK